MNYPHLDFDRQELSSVMEEYYSDILAFITQPAFQVLFSEMMSLPPNARPKYVADVWLKREVLEQNGVKFTAGILIQTSAFGDRRPTLFVVKKFLPEKFHGAWENVNWTFNNDFEPGSVPSDPENSWRMPLKVAVQNALIAQGADLQSVPSYAEGFSQRLDTGEIEKSQRKLY